MQDIFDSQPYTKIALAKIKPTHRNFRIYSAGWIGDYETTDTMQVTGAVFREALSGPRKGQLCIVVPGTKRTAYVTQAEMKAVEQGQDIANTGADEQKGGEA